MHRTEVDMSHMGMMGDRGDRMDEWMKLDV